MRKQNALDFSGNEDFTGSEDANRGGTPTAVPRSGGNSRASQRMKNEGGTNLYTYQAPEYPFENFMNRKLPPLTTIAVSSY